MAAEGAFATPNAGGRATVQYGVYAESNTVVGKSIAEVRAMYARLWNIPADAVAYKGKTALGEDHIIESGDTVEFFRKAGEKGLVNWILRFTRGGRG